MKIENKDNVKNNLYYSDVPCLDFDNLELMFLYIENYKQFRDFSLNLNAKYLEKYESFLEFQKLTHKQNNKTNEINTQDNAAPLENIINNYEILKKMQTKIKIV